MLLTRVAQHALADAVHERAHALIVQVAVARAVDGRLLAVHLRSTACRHVSDAERLPCRPVAPRCADCGMEWCSASHESAALMGSDEGGGRMQSCPCTIGACARDRWNIHKGRGQGACAHRS